MFGLSKAERAAAAISRESQKGITALTAAMTVVSTMSNAEKATVVHAVASASQWCSRLLPNAVKAGALKPDSLCKDPASAMDGLPLPARISVSGALCDALMDGRLEPRVLGDEAWFLGTNLYAMWFRAWAVGQHELALRVRESVRQLEGEVPVNDSRATISWFGDRVGV